MLRLFKRMASTVPNLKIKHDTNRKFFYADFEGARAVLQYEILPTGTLDLYHTEVPEEHRGKGIAAQLVKSVFNHCMIENLKMKLTCTYVQKYFSENKMPEYAALVVD